MVIMPEGSKTNGLGILNIEKDIVKMINTAAGMNENLRIHALRFDHQFNYYSPYNSHDETGFYHFVGCLR